MKGLSNVTLSEAEQRLADVLRERYRGDASDVIEDVARLFGVEAGALRSKTRTAILVDARSVVALVLRHRGFTVMQIGRCLNRDHSTISHLCKRIERDRALRSLVEELAA